jgi:hypothetical protein
MMTAKRTRVSKVVVGVVALLAAAGIATSLIPAAQEMMVDMALSMLFTIGIAVLQWRAGSQLTDARAFWRLLACAWIAGLLGNIVWGMYEMLTGEPLPILSWVDAIYVARDILVLMALWRYPGRPLRRREFDVVAITAATAATAWLLVFRPTLTAAEITPQRVRDFIGVAIYPILDAGLIYAALLTWTGAAKGRLRHAVGLILASVICYGIANSFQFGIRVVPDYTSGLPDHFWLLSDLLAGAAAAYILWREPASEDTTSLRTPLTRWLIRLPYLAALIATSAIVGDLIVRRGQVDLVLVACCVIALGALAGRLWLRKDALCNR